MKWKQKNTHRSMSLNNTINCQSIFIKRNISNILPNGKKFFSSRMMDIQVQMCERAIELLLLPEDDSCLLLDIGCGSGLSGSVLEDQGHIWIGVDISPAMLS